MASDRLGDILGIREELIKKASDRAFIAHKSPDKAFLLKKIHSTNTSEVIISFPASWSVSDWYADKSFGETKINLSHFPSLRSIGNDELALVNKAFLRRFEVILSNSSLKCEVTNAMKKEKRIVFTGHSSGAAMAILASLWTLEQHRDRSNRPFCVTFGSPLIGNHIFSHATRRENWSRYFIHFVLRYDIIPRILLAPISSLERTINSILLLFSHNHKSSGQIKYSEFYNAVMKNAAKVTSHRACNLMGSTNLLLETVRNFIALSPYRPFGTFVLCTGNGKLIVVRNSEAVLQALFHSALLKKVGEGDEVAKERVLQHLGYVKEVEDGLQAQHVVYLDNLEEVPLSKDNCSNDDAATVDAALDDLGLGLRARLCLRAAGAFEKQKSRNEAKIGSATAYHDMMKLEDYKEASIKKEEGYYDAFKLQKYESDFRADVSRLKLASVWDEIIDMLKRYQLPDEFEGNPEWFELGTKFRRLVEPLDIATYYRQLKNEDTGPYMERARPKRYRYIQRWLEHQQRMEPGASWESCFWAETEELISRSRKEAFDEEFKKRIVKLVEDVNWWIETQEIPKDVLLEGSTFVKWWTNLPREYQGGILKNLPTDLPTRNSPASNN